MSKKHKLIFIKGRKVASTSMEVLLSSICDVNDIITPISPIDELKRIQSDQYRSAQNYGFGNKKNSGYIDEIINASNDQLKDINMPKTKYYNHMPLRDVLNLNPFIDSSWLIFGIERCPYSKIISYANMLLKYNNYKSDGLQMINDLSSLKRQLAILFSNKQYLDVKNINLYKDRNNEISMKLLKYESLEQDISKLMKSKNIHNYIKLPHLKAGMSSNTLKPEDIFTSKQISTINTLFKEEFDTFGYTMCNV